MKRSVSLFICLLLLCLHADGQQKNYRLSGSLGVESGETFTYIIDFTDSAGQLKGHAYTYLREEHKVKTTITGRIDRNAKTLYLKETAIVGNSGFYSAATICLVKAKLRYRSENGKMVLGGPITSADASNAVCASGSITLEAADVLKELFAAGEDAAPAPPAKPKANVIVVYDTARRQAPAKVTVPVQDKITQGREKIIDWETNEVLLDIWDGGKMDYDRVTVMVNGKEVLKNYTLAKDKKQIRFPLSGSGTDIITIAALNEGNEPPNTADILLRDGDRQHAVTAYNDAGREAVIKIRKKKP